MSSATPRPRILIVDRHPGNAQLVTAHLVFAGYDVTVVAERAAMSRQLEQSPPDLVLLSETELCGAIKGDDRYRRVPVVMVGPAGSVDVRVHGEEAGADDFLTQPVSRSELLLSVKSLLRIRNLVERLDETLSEVDRLKAALGDEPTGRDPQSTAPVGS